MSHAAGAPRHQRYPISEPFATHRIHGGDGHNLYVEETGRRDGIPAVVLHGGPGGGVTPKMRGYFDPQRYHVVRFDQRGSRQSTPLGWVEANTTWDLVRDIETVRERLGIERWLVFGGSGGSTLALGYAEYRPERVTGLVLRGIFLGRPREVDWLLRGGVAPARRWPEARLGLVPDAGHSRSEPGIIDELVRATDALAGRLG